VPGGRVPRFVPGRQNRSALGRDRWAEREEDFLCERFGDVFITDDDVKAVYDHQESRKLSPEEAVGVVEHLADTAEQMGVYLFGLTDNENPLHYSPHRPFQLTGMTGGGYGCLKATGCGDRSRRSSAWLRTFGSAPETLTSTAGC